MTATLPPTGGADTLAPPQPTTSPIRARRAKADDHPRRAACDSSIRPFTYHASDEELADLKRRIAATRWPERETVDDGTQGVQLDTDAEARRILGEPTTTGGGAKRG